MRYARQIKIRILYRSMRMNKTAYVLESKGECLVFREGVSEQILIWLKFYIANYTVEICLQVLMIVHAGLRIWVCVTG
jgi:hypothetical protein